MVPLAGTVMLVLGFVLMAKTGLSGRKDTRWVERRAAPLEAFVKTKVPTEFAIVNGLDDGQVAALDRNDAASLA